jgi:EmrB/QacA subfamily drug resistance transporter
MLTPVGMAMLFRAFPPEQRMQASRILIFPTVIAPASGPVLGGFLVDRLSWRWVFFVNVPIGIAALLFGALFLHEHREEAAGRFDLPGFVLAATGFPLLMFALTEGPSRGWTSPSILLSGIGGLLVVAAFVIVELRTDEPMVQLRLLGNRLFRTSTSVLVTAVAGFLGLLFLVPLFLQEARGASALSSGLTTFPEAIGVLCSTQIVARVYPYIGPRRLMIFGGLVVTTAMLLLLLVGLDTNAWAVRALMFIGGAGMANIFLPNQAAAFTTIDSRSTGRASTLFNAERMLGSAAGVAILSSVLGAVGVTYINASGVAVPNISAYHAAFAVAALFPFSAALLALFVPDKDAAPSMVKRGKRSAAPPAQEPLLVE